MKLLRLIVVAIALCSLGCVLYFIIIYPNCYISLDTLEAKRNYFSIVGSIVASIIGITGVLVGAFYYFDKERRNKLSQLKSSIEKYDDIVMEILNLEISSDSELKTKRALLTRVNEQIELMLDNKTGFLPFRKKSAMKILAINSFVEKSDLLMRSAHCCLNEEVLQPIRDEYQDVAKGAKILCYLKCR